MKRCLLVLVLTVLAACTDAYRAGSPPTNSSAAFGEVNGALFEANATVLESPGHGPALCVGAILTSLPPQCGDVPLTIWDWDWVEGETRSAGTTWGGNYRVVGTYDGERFTPTERPTLAVDDRPSEPPAPEPPCPTPVGGWKLIDPSRTGESRISAAAEAVRREPDFAGYWLFRAEPPSEGPDPRYLVLTFAFTGDLERHEAELRDIWGGALCVTRHKHSSAELGRIMNGATSLARERGLRLLSWGANEQSNRIDMTAIFADQEDQAAMDVRFGTGSVVITSRLRRLG